MADIFTLFGRIAINADDANRQIDSVAKRAAGMAKKIKNALVAAGVTKAVSSLVKASVSGYAEYEQLVGGVETLFGTGGKNLEQYAADVGKSVEEVEGKYNQLMNAQGTVFANAKKAYQTAGVSANQYMNMATSFAASLVSSLGGDTEAAAKLTDTAILDMSDNANKMGTDLTSIQNAYQGFAKQNYTMLDNLKLGYGGTQSEMKRLLKDAQKLSGQKYNIKNLDDVLEAIHVIQEEMGITGTTQAEAAETISGSWNATKAAWENLVMGLADGNADIDKLFGNLTASAKNVVTNIGKVVPSLLKNMGTLLRSAGKTLVSGWENTVYPFIQDKLKVKFGVELPEWGKLVTDIQSWWNSPGTAYDKIKEVLTWTLGTFVGPSSDSYLPAIKEWWEGQAKPSITDIVQWTFFEIAVPAWADNVDKITKWWNEDFKPGLSNLATYILDIRFPTWDEMKEKAQKWWDDTKDFWGMVGEYWTNQNTQYTPEDIEEINRKNGYRVVWDEEASKPVKIDLETGLVLDEDAENDIQSDIAGFDLNGKVVLEADPSSGNTLQRFLDNLALNIKVNLGIDDNGHGGFYHKASGLPRVPYNGFKARLHENEAVLTASQAAIWRGERMPSLAGIGALTTPAQTEQPINMTINISGSTGSPYEVAQAVRNAVDDWRWRG